MAKAPFKAYLHDDNNSYELAESIKASLKKQGINIKKKKLMEALSRSRPFYEVTLDCEIDLETLEVTLVKATL